jgi:predicted enzyme related to lactoylglutathione lyase
MPARHIATIVINSAHPSRLVAFWSAFLDTTVAHEMQGLTWLQPTEDGGVSLAVQHVEAKAAAQSDVHIDIVVEDLDVAQRQVEGRGGSFVAVHRLDDGFEWRIVADPDGNQFCIAKH